MGSPNFGMGPNYGSAFGGLPQQPWQTWQQPQYQYQQFSPFQQTQYSGPSTQGTPMPMYSQQGGNYYPTLQTGGKGGGYGAGGMTGSGNSGTLGNGLFSQNNGVTGPNFKSTDTQPQNSGTLGNGLFSQNSVTGPNFKSTDTQPTGNPAGMGPAAPVSSPSGQWWNINPLSSSLQQYWNQQLGNWGGSGNVNDLLTKWNSFTDPNQAFTWAQANAGNEGLYGKNLLMNLSNIARMASPVDPNAGTSSLGNNWDYWTNLAESWNPGQRLGT